MKKEWLPFCSHAYNIKSVDLSSKVAYLKMELPLISDREMYLYGIGIDKLEENGKILIISKTIDEDQDI